jgi:hypothetical protein
VVNFTLRPIYPDIHSIRGWVGPGDALDVVAKRKIMSLPGIEFHSFSLYPATSLTSLSRDIKLIVSLIIIITIIIIIIISPSILYVWERTENGELAVFHL